MRALALKLTTIVSLVVGTLLLALPAGAAATTRVADAGFWWQGNAGVGVETAPPDVERGQVLLEASPSGTTSIGAVRAELKDGEGNPTLTLPIASGQGAATATILACQAGSGWSGTHSGRFDSAPKAACDLGSVQGLLAEDGGSFSFPLGPLQFGDQFNVVLVAGASAEGTVTPFRLIFADPKVDGSIVTTSDTPPPAPPPPTTAGTFTPAPTTSAPSNNGGSFSPAPTTTRAPVAAPAPTPTAAPVVAPVQPAIPEELQGESFTAPIRTQQLAAPAGFQEAATTNVGRLRLLGLAVLVLGTICGLLWWRADGSVPLRAVFAGVDEGTLAQLNAKATGESDAAEGGLGRFRRGRSGQAPKLF